MGTSSHNNAGEGFFVSVVDSFSRRTGSNSESNSGHRRHSDRRTSSDFWDCSVCSCESSKNHTYSSQCGKWRTTSVSHDCNDFL